MRPFLLLLIAATIAHFAAAQQTPVEGLAEKDFTGVDAAVFTDAFFLRLKPGINSARVEAITNPVLKQIAVDLLAGRLNPADRGRACQPFEPVDSLAKRLKTSTYSQFENPTGIFFEAGDAAVVSVGPTNGQNIALRVHDFGRRGSDRSYPLKSGVNVIRIAAGGLGYISYFTDQYQTAPKVQVSILTGKVNGVFDPARHTNKDWQRLLAGAVCDVIDIQGKYVHLVFPVAELRQSCPEKGVELVGLYDRIIRRQQEVMGLVKYGTAPKNHKFGRVIWKGYMHADGMGAAFHNDTMRDIANPDRIPTNSWGIAHEFGHVNQTRPGLKWVSTTEVTNNIFSSWTNYELDPTSMRLEHEKIDGGDGNVVGGRFNAFLNSAVVAGESWLCQKGPDKMQGYENGGDHFVKLVPLWQLQLYFAVAGRGNREFYADIFEKVRRTDEAGLTNGQLQLNFMRNLCDATRLDLTGFLATVGMLKPIDRELDDYTRGRLTITQQECDDLVRHASRYPKPESPVIHYISANSVKAFRDRLPVLGQAGQGVAGQGNTRTIDHAVWKNVTVFETYRSGELVKIAMVGTGSPDNSSTLVQYPEGATRIEAVAWDGKRTLVYGQR